MHMHMHMYMYMCMYVYIYIYIYHPLFINHSFTAGFFYPAETKKKAVAPRVVFPSTNKPPRLDTIKTQEEIQGY